MSKNMILFIALLAVASLLLTGCPSPGPDQNSYAGPTGYDTYDTGSPSDSDTGYDTGAPVDANTGYDSGNTGNCGGLDEPCCPQDPRALDPMGVLYATPRCNEGLDCIMDVCVNQYESEAYDRNDREIY
jgi:hypothetical protein